MEIEDIAGSFIKTRHPLASWVIWRPLSTRKASMIEDAEFQQFAHDCASGYVSTHGSFVVFEHRDDAILWIISQ